MTHALAIRSERDHRIDFYRGIALAMIFVNHIPGNLWENFTTRNFGFSDSAELFVFLAGFASAYAYARPFEAGHRLVATLKLWRRAGTLYLVHIMLTMFAVGLFAWAAAAFGNGGYMEVNELKPLLTQPLDTFVGLVTMCHQLKFVNILPMYTAMLLMAPAHLWLAAKVGRNGMLVAAVALWAVAADTGLNVPNHPYTGGWFFNPFAWQLIFAIGLYCGLAKRERGYAVPFVPVLYAAALAFLFYAFVFIDFELWGMEQRLHLPVMIAGFDKTFVSLPRLAHILAVLYVFAYLPKTSPLAHISKDNPFTRMGRHSLPIFATGTALSLVAQVVKFGQPPHLVADTLIVAGGLALQFLLARYLDWWGTAQKLSPLPSPQVAAAPLASQDAAAAGGFAASLDVAPLAAAGVTAAKA